MVAQRGANDDLTDADVRAHADTIRAADLLCVDAYGLLHEPRRTATLHAMQLARAAGTRVCCDLVPHDLDRYASFEQWRAQFVDADVIVSSATTLARLLGVVAGHMRPLDEDQALAVAHRVADAFDLQTQLVRFGYGHCSWSLAFHRTRGVLWCEPTGYAEASADQVAGFGDTLTATELHRLCTETRSAA